MKTTLFAATSEDGFIARTDGQEDFLSGAHWSLFVSLAREYGNFIVGRKTYELVRDWEEEENFEGLSDLVRIVVTRNAAFSAPGFLVASSPGNALEQIKSAGLSRALVIGGTELNTAFARAGLLDDAVFSIEPVSIHEGKSVFSSADVAQHMQLRLTENRPDSRIVRHYTFS